MNKINKLIPGAAVAVTLLFSSCLKDKNIEDQEYGMAGAEDIQLVEFPDAPSKTFALNYSDQDTSFTLVNVHLNSAEPATEDVQVEVELDNSIIDDYNAANGSSFEPAPSGIYSIPSLSITIPKGSRDGAIMINTNPSQLSLGQYALGLKIKSISSLKYTLSGNYQDVFIYLGVRNKYDGVYELKGYHNRVPYNYPYDVEMYLTTITPKSVAFYWPDVSSNGHPIGVAPGATSWYGAAISPAIIFDPSTDKVTDVYNLSSAVGITMFTGAGTGESRFDPDTKTIYVYFNYGDNPDRAFYDTLTYVGPRP